MLAKTAMQKKMLDHAKIANSSGFELEFTLTIETTWNLTQRNAFGVGKTFLRVIELVNMIITNVL